MTDKTRKTYEQYKPSVYKQTQIFSRPYIVPQTLPAEDIKSIFQLVYENDIEKINEFTTTKKIPLDVKDTNDDTLLHIILKKNPEEVSELDKLKNIRQLSDVKSMITSPNKFGITPLHIAAMYQYSTIIDELCFPGMNVSPIDINHKTPLHYAFIGYVRKCKYAQHLQLGTEVYAERKEAIGVVNEILSEIEQEQPLQKPFDRELLHYPDPKLSNGYQCIHTHLETIKKLISLGASLNALDDHKMTPIYYAFQNNDIDIIEYLLQEKLINIDTPVNSYGETPRDYCIKLYNNHLGVFGGNSSNYDKLSGFVEYYMTHTNQMISSKNLTIPNIEQMPIRALIMFIEYIRRTCETEMPNTLNELNLMYYIDEEIPQQNEMYHYPIVDIYNEEQQQNKIDVLPDNIIQLYYEIQNNVMKRSTFNSYWNRYLKQELNKYNPFTIYLTTIQQNLINSGFSPNEKPFINILRDIYDTISKKIIEPYRTLPEQYDANYFLAIMMEIIVANLSNIICYDLYRQILLIVTEEITKYMVNMPTTYGKKMAEFDEQNLKFNVDMSKIKTIQKQHERDIKSIGNGLNNIWLKINSLYLDMQNGELQWISVGNISSMEEMMRFENKYFDTIERILEFNIKNPQLVRLDKSMKTITNAIGQLHAQYVKLVPLLKKIVLTLEKYLIENSHLTTPIVKTRKELLPRLNKIIEIYGVIDSRMMTTLLSALNNFIANPIPPQTPPIPPREPRHQQPNQQLILNYVDPIKDDLFDIIIQQLPLAIVGQIIDNTNVNFAFDNAPSESMKDLFTTRLMSKLKEVDYKMDDVAIEINKRISSEVIPIYQELCDISVRELKSMLDGYLDYIANEIQYLNVFGIIIDNA